MAGAGLADGSGQCGEIADGVIHRRSLRNPLRQPQRRDDRLVCGQQFRDREFRARTPPQGLPVETRGLAAILGDHPYIEQNLAHRVLVAHADQGPRRGDLDAELLVELARQSLEARLARLGFPAGKLPTAGKVLTLGPLREQHAILRVGKHAGDDPHDAP
jgi:hypothetical protein